MAQTKKTEAVADSLDGTVEGLALTHFHKEKAAYEARTGEKVWYEPANPLTRTPIKESVVQISQPHTKKKRSRKALKTRTPIKAISVEPAESSDQETSAEGVE